MLPRWRRHSHPATVPISSVAIWSIRSTRAWCGSSSCDAINSIARRKLDSTATSATTCWAKVSHRVRTRNRPYQRRFGDDLDERADGRVHQPDEIIGRGIERQRVEQRMASSVDLVHSVFEDRCHQPGAIAEVVLRCRVVALAGGSRDVTQRHRLDAAFGEQLLCHFDQCEPGRIPARSHSSERTPPVLLNQLSHFVNAVRDCFADGSCPFLELRRASIDDEGWRFRSPRTT